MANKKFSEFTLKTDSANVDFVVGYDGTDNVRIAPSNLSSGGASSLNGLSDVLIDTTSEYVGTIPSGLSGNPQGNTTLGIEAGLNLTSGGGNSFVGDDAGKTITTGARNLALGKNSMSTAATGINDTVAVGYSSGSQATGSSSVHVGRFAAYTNQASGHISIGQQAGLSQTSGEGNINVGYQAGYSNSTGARNVKLGYQAGKVDTNDDNIFIGHQAGLGQVGSNNSDDNIVIGTQAKYNNSTNFRGAVVIGHQAAYSDSSLFYNYNVAIGYRANYLSNGNYDSVAIGYKAGYQASADGNTIIGYNAQEGTITGAHNTIIGKNANVASSSATGSNNTVLGYNAASSAASVSNEITLGNSSISTLRCAVTSITSLSDQRDKSEIKDLQYGLDFIDSLQPREFVWDNRAETDKDGEEFYSANKGKKDFGFIAQEVQSVDDDTLRLVYDENPDKLELSYGKLVPVLVQAIKELKAEVELLKA